MCFLSVPIKMSETVYDAFDKIAKKQNKEQVPPAAEQHKKKPSANKASKTSTSSSAVTRPTPKNLAEAFKAVSKASVSSLSDKKLKSRDFNQKQVLKNVLHGEHKWTRSSLTFRASVMCWSPGPSVCNSHVSYSFLPSPSWISATLSNSWLTVSPCFQKTSQCGSRTWRDT